MPDFVGLAPFTVPFEGAETDDKAAAAPALPRENRPAHELGGAFGADTADSTVDSSAALEVSTSSFGSLGAATELVVSTSGFGASGVPEGDA